MASGLSEAIRLLVQDKGISEELVMKTIEEFLALLEAGDWETLVAELMLRYYDPLYLHTLPQRRIEISLEPFSTGLSEVVETLDRLPGS